MLSKLLTLLFVFITFNILLSQTSKQKCLTNIVRETKVENNSALILEYNRIEQFTQNWISENKNILKKTNTVVQIPVVVHIIWREDSENISDEQIRSQITVLNEDFRKLNKNFSNTPPAFQAVSADIEMEFKLSIQDPDGNPTNGITRTQTTVDDIAAGTDYFKTARGGKDPWDQKSYLNFWICDVGEEGLLGFATFPSDNDPGDGVVIPSNYFGITGTAANSSPNNLGRTATHEVGHYFNLEHIWGPEESGCVDDDSVEDTPKQDFDSEGCNNTFPLLDACTPVGNGIMFMNYMDYTDDACMTMFTNGQKMRMLAALNGPRKGLLTSRGLSEVTSVEETAAIGNVVSFYPNPANNVLYVHSSRGNNLGIRIFNILGEVVYSNKNISSNAGINISTIKTGVYFVESNISGKINFKKILISK